jgi:hypothetical protein
VVWVVAVAAALLFLALRIPYLDLPLERDEGEYAYVAQHLLEPDFVPYRDAFVHKPPGAFLVYFLALHTSGESVREIRLFALLWMAATLLAVAHLGHRLAGPLAGAFAGLAFAAASSAPSLLGPSTNTEMLLLLPLVASLSVALRAGETGRLGAWALAGALGATACWFKPLAAPHAVVLVAYALLGAPLAAGRRPSARTRLAWAAALAAGALAVSFPVLLYFAARGSFAAFLDAVFLYNAGYAAALSLAQGMDRLHTELSRQLPEFVSLWLLAAAALAGPFALPRKTSALLAGWLVACFVGLSLGFYYRPHYFMLWIPALCILAGCAATGAVARAPARPGARRLAVAALLLLIAAPIWRSHDARLVGGSPAAVSRMLYGQNPFAESPAIAEAIRSVTEPEDTVFIVGSEPQILFHAQRRSATRYILTYPLMSGHPSAGERQREALEEVQRARPGVVLLVRVPFSHLRHPRAPALLLHESTRLAQEEYELEAFWLATPIGFQLFRGDEARAFEEQIGGSGGRANLALYRRRVEADSRAPSAQRGEGAALP